VDEIDEAKWNALIEAYAGTRRRKLSVKNKALIIAYLKFNKVKSVTDAIVLGQKDSDYIRVRSRTGWERKE
jgi:hypothetical protein